MNRTLYFLVSCFFISLVGCGGGHRLTLTTDFKKEVRDARLVSIIPQKEIGANTFYSNTTAVGAQYGLVGALVSTAIDMRANQKNLKASEEQLVPIRNALIDVDYSEHFNSVVLPSFDKFEWLNIADKARVERQSQINPIDGELLLKITTTYKLSSNFTFLTVISEVSLNRVEGKKDRYSKEINFREEQIAKNYYKYVSPTIPRITKSAEEYQSQLDTIENWYKAQISEFEADTNRNRNKGRFLGKLNNRKREKLKKVRKDYTFEEANLKMAEVWAKDDAQVMKRYLNESAYELSKMILLDFSDTKSTKEYKKDKSIEVYEEGFQLVSQSDKRAIVRDVQSNIRGQLCSVSKTESANICSLF